MVSPFLDLLRQISEGVVIYEPFRRDAQGLGEFQDTVRRLREMERLGLIGRLYIQTRTSRDAEYVEMVMVQGGLQWKGNVCCHIRANNRRITDRQRETRV